MADRINRSLKSAEKIIKNLNKAFKKKKRFNKDPYKQARAEIEAVLNSGADEPNIKIVSVRHVLREHPDWKLEKILKEVGFTKKDLADLRKVVKAMKRGKVMC